MEFFIAKKLKSGSFEDLDRMIREELKNEGFGVITEIDLKKTFREKIDVDFRNYKILGACNPTFAHKALLAEDKIGTFLPCNVVIQESPHGGLEVMVFDPASAMMELDNPELSKLSIEIRERLIKVLDKLN
ncbi:MAG: DUF302 domain-containing protein [Cyclobacteriaceae bacterium]|nr:DUF302 domain-containing protein [Cyclobacteriaceae bacterium]